MFNFCHRKHEIKTKELANIWSAPRFEFDFELITSQGNSPQLVFKIGYPAALNFQTLS